MSQPFYEIDIRRITAEPVSDGHAQRRLSEQELTLRVDTLHEIAPKLAALYPVPVVKRSHRRKKEGA